MMSQRQSFGSVWMMTRMINMTPITVAIVPAVCLMIAPRSPARPVWVPHLNHGKSVLSS
jgi:hypothetical protein